MRSRHRCCSSGYRASRRIAPCRVTRTDGPPRSTASWTRIPRSMSSRSPAWCSSGCHRPMSWVCGVALIRSKVGRATCRRHWMILRSEVASSRGCECKPLGLPPGCVGPASMSRRCAKSSASRPSRWPMATAPRTKRAASPERPSFPNRSSSSRVSAMTSPNVGKRSMIWPPPTRRCRSPTRAGPARRHRSPGATRTRTCSSSIPNPASCDLATVCGAGACLERRACTCPTSSARARWAT